MTAQGQLIGIDPGDKRTYNFTAKHHRLMAQRILGVKAERVAVRALLWVHFDGTIHPAPPTMAEFNQGTLVIVSAVNALEPHVPGWFFRGFMNKAVGTSGKCFLAGLKADKDGAMAVTDCPLTLEWVDRFIEFYDGSPKD